MQEPEQILLPKPFGYLKDLWDHGLVFPGTLYFIWMSPGPPQLFGVSLDVLLFGVLTVQTCESYPRMQFNAHQ